MRRCGESGRVLSTYYAPRSLYASFHRLIGAWQEGATASVSELGACPRSQVGKGSDEQPHLNVGTHSRHPHEVLVP